MNDKEITREETEKTIRCLMEDIWTEYLKYKPDGRYLDISLIISPDVEGGTLFISANNRYWEGGEDENRPINFHIFKGVDE